jgi:predicted HTH transcriptional regulator
VGGDIIYGISEKNSIPKDIIGIEIIKTDELLRKIDNLMRDGLQPRIAHQIKLLPISENKYVLLLHIEKSWNRPHRVILGGSTAFYARNSKGKYLLDTFELRDMFNLSNTLLPAEPGESARFDTEYVRNGTCDIFMFVAPLEG